MISGISSMSSMNSMNGAYGMGGMRPPRPQIDKNGDKAIDKSEFQDFASKIQEKTGKEIDVDEIFSKLDSDEDGKISKEEGKGMKELLPPPPQGMRIPKSDLIMQEKGIVNNGLEFNSQNFTVNKAIDTYNTVSSLVNQ